MNCSNCDLATNRIMTRVQKAKTILGGGVSHWLHIRWKWDWSFQNHDCVVVSLDGDSLKTKVPLVERDREVLLTAK